jgi:hypothetical protein
MLIFKAMIEMMVQNRNRGEMQMGFNSNICYDIHGNGTWNQRKETITIPVVCVKKLEW